MLIGPTGVGKTTTCAKIVANNWRNERKVGFITADTYRLEAVSQLKSLCQYNESSNRSGK
jgi:flagellar biosynthesis protein FlhF